MNLYLNNLLSLRIKSFYMVSLTVLLGIIGTQEIIIIALVILLLFGGRKIPELMKGLGKGVKQFKDGVKGIDEDEPKKESSK